MSAKGPKIAFLGCGKLGKSILRGLKSREDVVPSSVIVSVTREESQAQLAKEFEFEVCINNNRAVSEADLIVLAMKPAQVHDAIRSLHLNDRPRIWVSLAAGLSCERIEALLPPSDQVYRAMPNTSATFSASMTMLFSRKNKSEFVEEFFRKIGETIWLAEESMIDFLTPVTASSPAFFYLICEGMERYMKDMNLSPNDRSQLIGQTLLGVARKILNDSRSLSELLSEVATPGGMTIEGLRVLTENQSSLAMEQALQAAFEKSKSLAKKS